MTRLNILIFILIASAFFSCNKEAANQEIIPVPNGDFELWDMQTLLIWQTNSCPACDPPFETYIVQKVTDTYSGQFAAKFIYNNVYSSFANNKFSISRHPTYLKGFIKSTITAGDTAIIHVDLFLGNNLVDNGSFYEISSTALYKKIEIQLTQNSSIADSALIRIVGGKKQNTVLYADSFEFIRDNE